MLEIKHQQNNLQTNYMEQLPPGFRFYPTEEELISFYLHNKLHSQKPEVDRIIPSIDIYNFDPSQLPEQASKLCHKEMEQWFFFTPQQEREARGGRPNRTTATGYWKATGSPNYVYSANKVIGVKKTMVFYEGKAPNGRKTKWKMNEYKEAIKQEYDHFDTNASSSNSTTPKLRHELSLCRVYVTSGCARAFDRRPPGATTTLNSNTISSSQNDNNNSFPYNRQLEIGQVSGTQHTHNVNNTPTTMLEEESNSIDDSFNSREYDRGTTHNGIVTMEENNNSYDNENEMTESLGSLIDWEQLGWL